MLFGSMIGLFLSKYETEYFKKHIFWVLFIATMSGNICVLGYVGKKIIMQAGLMTGCIVGIFSTFGAYGDPEQLNILAGFLSVGLAIVCYASLASLFWSTSVALESITTQGGLAIFMGLTMTDTSKLIQHAQKNTSFDPINESLGIYLNILNIFTRIVILLAKNEQKNKKKFSIQKK
jgi:FtsH-binding integral membrane protein